MRDRTAAARARRRTVTSLLLAATVALGCAPAIAHATTDAAPRVILAVEAPSCGADVKADATTPHDINLVIDDSGSMFSSGGKPIERWSQAKYALEVFAAMLGKDDTLNVYRLSDSPDGGPAVSLTGSESASARVAKIDGMQLNGGRTPYAPVKRAYEDLAQSPTPNRWLVVLTDGEFNDRKTADVQSDLRRYASDNTGDGESLRVAFLAIGDDAPEIRNEPDKGVFSERAASGDLLDKMTQFANVIYERNLIPQTAPGKISPDIDLSEVLVFAQGEDVSIGDAVGSTTVPPSSKVGMSWVPNDSVTVSGKTVEPLPDKQLRGALASYDELAKGNIAFAIDGARTVDVFYKPKVKFGIVMRDAQGQPVAADKIVGGKYTLEYGFMDENCALVESPLLGDVDYSATVVQDGEVVTDSFQSGDEIDFDRGNVQLDVRADYLGGNTAKATIDLTVLQAARPTGFDVTSRDFRASELNDYAPPDGALALYYGLGSPGSLQAFTAEEWASVTPDSFTVTSDANLDFSVSLGARVGDVYVTPRAPGGDVYAASTGELALKVVASHTFDEQLYGAELDTTVVVVDDIPWLDRFVHWFADIGWKLLLALILLTILLGYIFKPRFSKKIKRNPSVTGVPMAIGQSQETGSGKFRIAGGRTFLPFVADVATLTYAPAGVAGFRPLKLKARRGGKMHLTNWKQIADRNNVSLNGNDLNEDTKRVPVLSPSTQVTATVPQQMRYEMYLNA